MYQSCIPIPKICAYFNFTNSRSISNHLKCVLLCPTGDIMTTLRVCLRYAERGKQTVNKERQTDKQGELIKYFVRCLEMLICIKA